jgi:hypothetical protein
MPSRKIRGFLILAGGIAVMVLKCAILLRHGSGKPHTPEPGEA